MDFLGAVYVAPPWKVLCVANFSFCSVLSLALQEIKIRCMNVNVTLYSTNNVDVRVLSISILSIMYSIVFCFVMFVSEMTNFVKKHKRGIQVHRGIRAVIGIRIVVVVTAVVR
mmetsp:Transcript_110685/g.226461  ORF Transcript_110685/g.226461 Transcript_110685/m.226461 type:complete len:113 (+) Transcript_110685:66-404(+)